MYPEIFENYQRLKLVDDEKVFLFLVGGGGAADRSILADVPAWFCIFKPRFCFMFLFVFADAVLCGQCLGAFP